MAIKLLYDIDQILNSGGRGTGLCRVSDLLLKQLSQYPEYEIHPLVTKKTKYTAKEYLSNNGLADLVDRIVYLPDLRATCVSASLMKKIKACWLQLIRKKEYLQILNSYDEYISLYSPISPLVYKSKLKTTIVVHDLISIVHPELCAKDGNFKKYELWMKDIKADKVICISQSTLNDFVKFRPDFDKSKLKVVPWGIEDRFKPTKNPEVKQKYGIKTKNYILTVSEVNKRKNLVHLLKAFAAFLNNSYDKDISLVIAGPKKKNFDEVTSQITELQNIQDKIVITGFVDDEDLPALYSEAEMFVFPSLYEGFGLPPLEALACGCPTICADNSSLPEVCGDAAIYISGHDIADTAQKIAELHNNSARRQTMSLTGLKQAKQFDWTKATREIFDLKGSN